MLHTRHDKCQYCDKEGPFCNVCLSHHLKHCQNEQDITPNEDCSDCEEDDEEEATFEDEEFIAEEEE